MMSPDELRALHATLHNAGSLSKIQELKEKVVDAFDQNLIPILNQLRWSETERKKLIEIIDGSTALRDVQKLRERLEAAERERDEDRDVANRLEALVWRMVYSPAGLESFNAVQACIAAARSNRLQCPDEARMDDHP